MEEYWRSDIKERSLNVTDKSNQKSLMEKLKQYGNDTRMDNPVQ